MPRNARAITHTLATFALVATAAFTAAPAAAQSNAPVVISQIYTPGGGGGGTTGFERSYVELHNGSAVPVGLGGWSLQYAEVNNSTWIITPLAGTIQPGRYFLVVEGNFTNPGNPPPPADLTGNTFIYPAGGKVALLSGMNPMVGCGAGLPLVDLLGYGSTDCSEGARAQQLSPTTALFRANSGCQDTDANIADFALGTPAPRNSSSAPFSCSSGPTGSAQIQPFYAVAGGIAHFQVSVTSGTVPASTGLYARADLSALGGSPSQPLYDDGTHGDATPNDNVFNDDYRLPLGAPPGGHTITFLVADEQSRTATVLADVVILPPVVISQLYSPGGGGGGATGFNHSYIELHNRGPASVALGGWSLHYETSTSGPWLVTPLSGSIAPGQYLLVQEGNAGGGNPLPAPDVVGSTFIVPGAGTAALLASGGPMIACGSTLPLVDLVGYGSFVCSEGSQPASSMGPNNANFRKDNGCRDTNVNLDDFAIGSPPTPRNTASPFVTCTSAASAPPATPTAFALRGAAPNPASHDLAINFSLANSAHARLALLDVAGRIVATRDVGAMGPGAHIVRFVDLSRLAPGVYLARLSQFGASVTTRVIVTR